MRLLGCFMVIMLHVAAANFSSFGPKWWAANVYDSLARFCVPLFLMISGATLLVKDEPVSLFLKKRLVRIFPVVIFWSCLYLAWFDYNGSVGGNWFVKIITGPVVYHFWYFYILVGIYLAVPVLRKFYLHSTLPEQRLFICTWLIVASLFPLGIELMHSVKVPILEAKDIYKTYAAYFFVGYLGYLMLGAYLFEVRHRFAIGVSLVILGVGGTICLTYFISLYLGRPSEMFYTYLSPLVIAAASGVFILFLSLKSGPAVPWLREISDCTIGIYCLHAFIVDRIQVFANFAISQNPWLGIPFIASLVFILSLACIFIFRRISVFRYVT